MRWEYGAHECIAMETMVGGRQEGKTLAWGMHGKNVTSSCPEVTSVPESYLRDSTGLLKSKLISHYAILATGQLMCN